MNNKIYSHGMCLFRIIALVVMSVITFVGIASAQEETGKVQQGLVSGEEVSEKTQEAYGLLSLSGTCSASLLRNDWAISAAHCVDAKDADGNTIPDRNRPGQNVLNPISGIKVKAAWGGVQTKKATRVETFWPYDVALIQLDSPFQVDGKTTGYEREVFWDQFPYFGSPGNALLKVFGRGINKFATGKGDNAVPASSDGKYRVGIARVSREERDGSLFWYPSEGKLMIAGGDSGGPSFVTVGPSPRAVLIGVHALARTETVPSKPKDGWDWVTRTPEAADAPIKPVWKKIEQIMGPLPAPPPEPSTGRTEAVFETTVPFSTTRPDDFNILYGVKKDGTLVWHRHILSRSTRITHSWNPTQNIGTGWAGFKALLPAGQLGMYALQGDGTLRWYWHRGALDGSDNWAEPPQTVGTGWNGFSQIIPMDKGVVYGLSPDGVLRWHKHTNYATGKGGVGGWANAMPVGYGWNFKTVFGGGNGVLYAITADGKLMWYKHKGYLNPVATPGANANEAQKRAWVNTWEEPREIAAGWGDFTKVFSSGKGHIYGVLPNGELKWYLHNGWQTGSPWNLSAGKTIATGWDSYVFAFARNNTSDAGSGNPEVDIIVK